MWSKTTVSYVALVTLAVIGSIAALPLTEINVPPVTATEKSAAGEVQQQEKSEPLELTDTQVTDTVENEQSVMPSEPTTSQTGDGLGLSTVAAAAADTAKTEIAESPVTGPVQPVPQKVDSPKHPKPSYVIVDNGGKDGKGGLVHSPLVEPTFSLFLDFFQPFQSFNSFQPFQPFLTAEMIRHQANGPQLINQHHQQPFGVINDPNESSEAIQMPSFNKLVEAYTNEFKNMVSSFDKSMLDMQHDVNGQQHELMNLSPGKEPIKKSTSKTEIVNGHKVQINETVYSNDDDNNKSFFHFKKIVVLPESMTDTKSDREQLEKFTSETTKKSDSMNKITHMPNVKTEINEPAPIKNGAELIPLEDHFQTAAASYYAPYAPYGHSSSAGLTHYYNRPPYYPMGGPVNYPGGYPVPSSVNYLGRPGSRPAPISLHGDVLVNELAAAHQQGTNAVLPPDVEIIDVNGKPQMQQGSHFNYNNHHHNHGQNKFPGRKN